MLNIWRLQLLVQFYNLKTMRAVSEAMMVSPAAVSTQLKELEAETNSVLLEKIGRNVKLTETGLKLVEQVQPILDQLEQINNYFQNTSQDVQGDVRIVGFDSALRTIIIPSVTRIKEKYPQINITITEQEPDQSLTSLNAHQFDLAIIAKFNPNDFLENTSTNKLIELGEDRLKVLVSSNNPLSELNSVTIKQLKDQNWIFETPDTYISKYIKQLCISDNVKPKILGVFQSYAALQVSVANNLSIGLLPELSITQPLKKIKPLNLIPETTRHIYLVVRKPQVTVPAIHLVSQEIQKQAKLLFNSMNK